MTLTPNDYTYVIMKMLNCFLWWSDNTQWILLWYHYTYYDITLYAHIIVCVMMSFSVYILLSIATMPHIAFSYLPTQWRYIYMHYTIHLTCGQAIKQTHACSFVKTIYKAVVNYQLLQMCIYIAIKPYNFLTKLGLGLICWHNFEDIAHSFGEINSRIT